MLRKNIKGFTPFGFTVFVGPWWMGTSSALVYYCLEMKKKYPKCLLYTNFACSFADGQFTDLRDLLELRNGADGIIIAFDENCSENGACSLQDCPSELLSLIVQQRLLRTKIVATSRTLSRVPKSLRDVIFSVVVCLVWCGRLINCLEYEYDKLHVVGSSLFLLDKGCKPLWGRWFVQFNEFR